MNFWQNVGAVFGMMVAFLIVAAVVINLVESSAKRLGTQFMGLYLAMRDAQAKAQQSAVQKQQAELDGLIVKQMEKLQQMLDKWSADVLKAVREARSDKGTIQ